MRRLIYLILLISTLCAPAIGHDFWLEADQFHLNSGDVVKMNIRLGHPEDKSDWVLDPDRLVAFRSFNSAGVSDLQLYFQSLKGESIPFRLNQSGLNVVAIESTESFSKLEAEKFNEYIDKEGLSTIKIYRSNRSLEQEPGREFYSRRAKALMQIGDTQSTDQQIATNPVGLSLEIVPLANPYALEKSDPLDVLILYRGRPLPGATVKLLNIGEHHGHTKLSLSNGNGIASFPRPHKGKWMMQVIWSDILEHNRDAEFSTIFSSLSFEFIDN